MKLFSLGRHGAMMAAAFLMTAGVAARAERWLEVGAMSEPGRYSMVDAVDLDSIRRQDHRPSATTREVNWTRAANGSATTMVFVMHYIFDCEAPRQKLIEPGQVWANGQPMGSIPARDWEKVSDDLPSLWLRQFVCFGKNQQ
jgi:hypothetical protein